MEKETTTKKKVAAAPKADEIARDIQKSKKWENKTRIYKIEGRGHNTPFVRIQGEDRPPKKRLLHFDKEQNKQRAIRYVSNFDSPFIDEQDASGWDLRPEAIVFEYGNLIVDEHQVALQKFLEVHPWNMKNGGNGSIVFLEFDPEAQAKEEVDVMLVEAKATAAALEADLATSEAVLRPHLGANMYNMKSDRLTRELLLLAKKMPAQFLEDINNDKLLLEGVAYTAIDFKICNLADNGTTFRWMNGEKIVAIPFGNNPYKFLGEWFTSDEGLEVMNKITQKLKKK